MQYRAVCALSLLVTGLGSTATVVAAPFGRTPGNFNVSDSGSATYSIPISVPPGVGGLQPSLALTYNSRSGDGLLGIGWGLSGFSTITRCNQTYAQDTAVGSPQLTSSDRFCLDGNRLRTTNGSTYGAAGATYQTEIANFSNVTSNGTAGSGPAWFKVQAKNGLTYEYGNSANSAILASGTTSVRTWALSAVRDRNGNAMTFTYNNDTANGSYRPASIQYTFTGSSSGNNGYTVAFTYQSRSAADQLWSYTIGGKNNELNYLSGVTVSALVSGSWTMVHGYNLTYANAPTTSRTRMSSVQECGTNVTTDCLAATTITYQDGAKGWGNEVADTGNATNLSSSMSIDVNGDGIDDLVYPDSSGYWYYELGTATGAYLGPYTTGIASTNYLSAVAIDFDSNGSKDILVPNASGNWRVLKFASAGAAFTYIDTTTSAAGVTSGSATVGDVDGDGRDDLIYAVSGGTGYAQPDYIYYRLNTGGAFSTTQGTLATFPNGISCSPCIKLGTAPFGSPIYRYTSRLKKTDFNGDGRADFLVYLASCTPEGPPGNCGNLSNPLTYTWNIFLSQPNGSYLGVDAVHYGRGALSQPPLLADFNGDGCTDLAVTISSVWNISYGTCGRTGSTSVLSPFVSTGVISTGLTALAVDWDGDGRTDIIQPAASGTIDWLVARSVGNNLSAWVDTGVPTGGTSTAQVADVNGDGLDDMVYAISTTSLKTRLHSGVTPDLATAFTDGYGVSYNPTYVLLSQAPSSDYSKGTSRVYPQQDYDGPLPVVNYYTASNGIGGTYTIDYQYFSAVMNLQGRGFAGFSSTRAIDNRNGTNRFVHYSTDFPTVGMVTSDGLTQSVTTKHISDLTNSLNTLTIDATANNQRVFPYIDNTTSTLYEVGGAADATAITTSFTDYSAPDNYGNFSSIATTLTDTDSTSPYYNLQWKTTKTSTFLPDSSANWCLNMPTEIDVSNTAPSVATLTRHTSFSPDYGYCRETNKIVEPSSPTYKVTTTYGYDSFGNLNSKTVTGVGMTARTTGINWGTSGQFPSTITNALGQQTVKAFDPTNGMQLSETDPNGILTSWQYDSFRRKTRENRPDGTATSWDYNNCATAGCVNGNNKMTVVQTILKTDSTTLSVQKSYLDSFDRPLVSAQLMINNNYSRVETQYDSLGRVYKTFSPCTYGSCVTYATTNTYDTIDRITLSQRPVSATDSTVQSTQYAYQGRTTTVTDPLGHVSKTIHKVTGSVGRSQDHNGYYINFNHDAFGSVVSVTDSASSTLKTTTYLYGLQAFPQTSTDTDLGARSYTVNALGELKGYTDAKSQSFTFAYDDLSRMVTRTEPDLTTTWTWGISAASHNIGRLAAVSAVSPTATVTDTYAYDSFGRISDHTTNLPTAGSKSFDYFYNATTGQLQNLKYPTSYSSYRLTVNHVYTNGILTGLRDQLVPSTVWWQANTYNPRGQVTEETTADVSGTPAVVTDRTFDPLTGWVGSIQTAVGGGSALQNESYLYDKAGNVTQRQNGNAGLTESFYYDNLNRLDHSVLGATTNLQMTYDGGAGMPGPGNITARSDVAGGAVWTYSPTHKHQVTQAGSSSFSYTYDANGNAATRNGTALSWTSYNYPSYVATSTESASFDYGADRQRWRMVYMSASGIETTYYASPLYEQVASSSVTDYRHYIYAGNRPVVVVSRNTAGAVNVRSLLADHQGSISSIVANSTGTTVAGESFTAFGNRRDAGTWNGAPTSAQRSAMDGVTRQGYTFQTVLGSMGLNHMNGRVEDAVTGRFLSADPVGTDYLTQSWNRYSYASNNPVSLIDPTGFTVSVMPNDAIDEVVVEGHRDPEAPRDAGGFGGGSGSGGSGGGGGGGAGGDSSLPEVVVTAKKPAPIKAPPSIYVTYLLLDPGQLDYPSINDPCPGSGGSEMAFRNGAPNDPSKGYSSTDDLPSDAMSYVAPNGHRFNAPPSADFVAVYNYGLGIGSLSLAGDFTGMLLASSNGAIFDFQRGNNVFNSNYTYAANYAIGILANGANHSLPVTSTAVAAYKNFVNHGKGSASAREAIEQGYAAAASGACGK